MIKLPSLNHSTYCATKSAEKYFDVLVLGTGCALAFLGSSQLLQQIPGTQVTHTWKVINPENCGLNTKCKPSK